MRAAEASAGTLGLELTPLEIQRAEDVGPAFEGLKAQTDALYVVVDGLVTANRTRIITLALGARLPTIFNNRVFVQAGGLMSFGPNFSDTMAGCGFRQSRPTAIVAPVAEFIRRKSDQDVAPGRARQTGDACVCAACSRV
jgi:uncharacterized membrane protein